MPTELSSRTADARPSSIRAAFRELHGRHLHGFALLLTLGDRATAARLADDALAAASEHADDLRHPERAAAWLRARVVRALPRRLRLRPQAEQRVALEPLGLRDDVIGRLATLSPRERAAIIAADVERLDPRDVETVVALPPSRVEQLLGRARRRYLDAGSAATTDDGSEGPLVARIRAVARRAMT